MADTDNQPSRLLTLLLTWNRLFSSGMTLPSRHLLVQSQQWKHQNNVWNLFNVNNKENKNGVVLVSLSLTLNRFSTLFWCFHCWLWASKYRLRNDVFLVFLLLLLSLKALMNFLLLFIIFTCFYITSVWLHHLLLRFWVKMILDQLPQEFVSPSSALTLFRQLLVFLLENIRLQRWSIMQP